MLLALRISSRGWVCSIYLRYFMNVALTRSMSDWGFCGYCNKKQQIAVSSPKKAPDFKLDGMLNKRADAEQGTRTLLVPHRHEQEQGEIPFSHIYIYYMFSRVLINQTGLMSNLLKVIST